SGRLYVSYADRVNGKTTVMLMFSDDQGVSWHTLPVSAGREGHAFFPNICIHPEKQVLGMVYYQTDRKGENLQVVFASIDRNLRLKTEVLNDPVPIPGKRVFFGD